MAVSAICAAFLRAETRSGLWLKLVLVSLAASGILLVAPIPFWDRSVTLSGDRRDQRRFNCHNYIYINIL